MACLDTTTLVDLSGQKGQGARAAAADRIRQLQLAGEEIVTTRFNLAELWVGVERSQDPVQERTAVQAILRRLGILEFDALCAVVFGRIKAHLLNQGWPRGDMDTLIASVARANGHSVVTRNQRHFVGIPGLTVWTY